MVLKSQIGHFNPLIGQIHYLINNCLLIGRTPFQGFFYIDMRNLSMYFVFSERNFLIEFI